MEPSWERAIELCRAAHRRLLETCARLTDAEVSAASLLPGWTVGHVLTHLARNADGHTRRLDGSLVGEARPRYPGGDPQRNSDIDAGACRIADELCRDIGGSIERLEAMWYRCAAAGWPNAELAAGDTFPTTSSPLRRLREVEVHHVDLNLGYRAEDWPEEYVRWELVEALRRLPERVPEHDDAARLLASLIGRAPAPAGARLEPWE